MRMAYDIGSEAVPSLGGRIHALLTAGATQILSRCRAMMPLMTSCILATLMLCLLARACARLVRSARDDAWRMRHEYERVPLRSYVEEEHVGSEWRSGYADEDMGYRSRNAVDPKNLYRVSVSRV